MLLTKRKVVEILRREGLRLNKRLGQNFLIDRNIARKIVRLSGVEEGDRVLEIGAGLGALTGLLAERASRLYAVEIDKGISRVLSEILSGFKNAEVLHKDFLEVNMRKLAAAGGRLKVVGNLPYYITTPVIERLIENRCLIDSAVIMVQEEVAERLLARPGLSQYSSITVFVRLYLKVKKLLKVKRTNFFPQPEVDSVLLKLGVLKRPPAYVKDEEFFIKIVRASFGKRRKTLVNALCGRNGLKVDRGTVEGALDDLGISRRARAEELDIDRFALLANKLRGQSSRGHFPLSKGKCPQILGVPENYNEETCYRRKICRRTCQAETYP